jgi:uncharacterized RDD family membrane protein YckC
VNTVKKGDRVSEFILEEPIGRGGFGEVWRARHHLWHDRQVAVKIPTRAEAVRDLTNEGFLQATLDHPGIAKSLGMDTEADPPYFIVELVEGRSLRKVLEERRKLPPAEVRSILDQVLSVLEYAHSRGVIHQDIKPENILLTGRGEVKLTDFGLGQTVHGESILLSASLRTDGHGPGGTIGYIAPEIRDREGRPDGRADLYSVGILLFELLTGRRPAGGEVPSDLESGLPPWCDRVFRGLYTRREARFADVAAVRASLGDPAGPRISPLVPPAVDLIGGEEAARVLGVGAERLRELVGAGRLRPVSVNGTLHYSRAAIVSLGRELGGPATAPAADGVSSAPRGTPVGSPPAAREVVPPRAERGPPVAGLFVRGIAAGIDFWFVVLLCFMLGAGLRIDLPADGFLGIILCYLMYAAICHMVTGRTFGKAILGLRVTAADGSPLSPARSLLRSAGYLVSFATLGFGFWMIPFQPRRQGLHDILADTVVIYSRH